MGARGGFERYNMPDRDAFGPHTVYVKKVGEYDTQGSRVITDLSTN